MNNNQLHEAELAVNWALVGGTLAGWASAFMYLHSYFLGGALLVCAVLCGHLSDLHRKGMKHE